MLHLRKNFEKHKSWPCQISDPVRKGKKRDETTSTEKRSTVNPGRSVGHNNK